ncbi:hypothetical protein AB6W15_004648 [Escherichia coli]|jgi:hypothetical protein|nr:hypothetical protein [Escherichia coli]EIO1705245.1 hypothetical protein [Escherichia coli]MBV4837873.1 hypothetical protein [Escherichia coli]MEC9971162.1 hypothetical protein [Escherichia marmotae]
MAGRIVPESSGEKNSFFRLLLDLENRGYFIRGVYAEHQNVRGRDIHLKLISSSGDINYYAVKKFRTTAPHEVTYYAIDKYRRWLRQYKRQPVKS